ncbi:TetR/AcrR family transcriptional regulator [Trinickia caryophylli]|uniref:Transcriptional regulator, TetR family n=1 Tax=Trinickia caryophylli TaxID=28094 RepID=A0A1X7F2W2_TRICW|nr:TetR/AcrR family transcriptional regulator [Trinickia caryophylli]PMS10381.1 TetR/AcrR family transcriptional regulator [Trinickia caryophylli]TRX19496.1 TetR/AcrR family transcriptional regulator [Trinickia caryophylli]WQE13195.1 TetR/AcrR family transcriptional regulator [Trinickia caryophylli]SMF44681.1 transcriptional regulator, TetR family [Trinickia caryophylli]GLU34496.1 regulatory protein TetR [Trinickia caryophylli]
MSQSSIPGGASRGPGRPREFDLDAVLDKAIGVFSEYGYHATSLSRLTAAVQITEGSLYKAFSDKRAVFIAAFERYVSLRGERLAQALESAQTGRECVRAMLEVYAEYSQGKSGRRGCLVVGSAVDLASSDPEMAKRVAAALGAHEKRLASFIRQGQEDGSISPAIDVAATALTLLSVLQGMRVLGKTGRSRDEVAGLVESALRLLD